MKKIKFFKLAGFLLSVGLFAMAISGCQKNFRSNTQNIPPNKNMVNIMMTDDPGFFDSVLIDVQGMAVKIDTSLHEHGREDHHPEMEGGDQGIGDLFHDQNDQNSIWDTLTVSPGIYDLLQLANGADTLLTSSIIPKGRIVALRITLGPNNSLVKNGVTYPLNLWNNYTNVYIRIFGDQIQETNPDNLRFWIDFDAGRSVVQVNGGMFFLRPFIRAYVVSNTGSVEGNVVPNDAFAVLTLYNNMDTLYALPGHEQGYFKFPGVDTGTYNLFINPSNGYIDTTITNIQVSMGKSTDVGVIQLHK